MRARNRVLTDSVRGRIYPNMEPAREIQPFLRFPSPQNLPRRVDLPTSQDERNFYADLFVRIRQILHDANPFCDSYFVLFQGAVELYQKKEEKLNRSYSIVLREERAQFRKTLTVNNPRNPLILHVHMRFQAQQIVDKEAGYRTEVKLYEEKGTEQEFTKLRAFHYLLEHEDLKEEFKFWKLFETLKRNQMEDDAEPIPTGETLKEREKRLERDAQKREAWENASMQLHQIDYNNLRQAFVRLMKMRFALENRLEKEMGLLPDFDQPVLIDSKLIGKISCLVFKILGEATQAELKDKTELLIACRISQIQFSLEKIQMVFLFTAKGGRRHSSNILSPEVILGELEKWFKAFRENGATPAPPPPEKWIVVKGLAAFFLGKSNDKIVEEVFKKPSFTRHQRDEDGYQFFKEWCDLRTSVVALRDLLSEKGGKMSVPTLEAFPTKERKSGGGGSFIQKSGSSIDGVRREGSSFIRSSHGGINLQKPSLQQVGSLLGQMGDLLELVIKEIEPIEAIPVNPILKLPSEESKSEAKPNEQLFKFYQLIEIFERLVLWHFQTGDHSLIWNSFFEHLLAEEEKQNPQILAKIQGIMQKFEAENEGLKKCDLERYQQKYGDRYYKALIEVAGIYYNPALPILDPGLETPVKHRYLRGLLYQDPKWRDKTPETFIAHLKNISMVEMLKVHGGHETIRSCDNNCVATAINALMRWLHEQRVRLPGSVKPEKVDKLTVKKLQKLDPFQKDILLINALIDLYLVCQAFKEHTLFTDLEKKNQKISPRMTMEQIFDYLRNPSNYPSSNNESKGNFLKIWVNRVNSESNVCAPLAETRINRFHSSEAVSHPRSNSVAETLHTELAERNYRPPLTYEVERLAQLTRYLKILLEEQHKRGSKVCKYTVICQELIARAAKEPLRL